MSAQTRRTLLTEIHRRFRERELAEIERIKRKLTARPLQHALKEFELDLLLKRISDLENPRRRGAPELEAVPHRYMATHCLRRRCSLDEKREVAERVVADYWDVAPSTIRKYSKKYEVEAREFLERNSGADIEQLCLYVAQGFRQLSIESAIT